VIAPVLAAFFSLSGVRKLEESLERMRVRLNARTHVLGYVLFAADAREAITNETREILRAQAPGKLFNAEIRVSTAAKALPARRETAWDSGADARGLEDHQAILDEVLGRLHSRSRADGAYAVAG
jgi:cellulose biosynthesis protein BcsQ